MKTSDKYKYWAMLSDYDMDTAKVLIENSKWIYVAYMCHQALERQLKGMYVYYYDKEAPKSHNLAFLLEKLTKAEDFPKNGEFSDEDHDYYEDFLTEVTYYYVSDYPFSYKAVANRFIDEKKAKELFEKVKSGIEYLRSLQEYPEPVDVEEMLKNKGFK